MRISDWSSDVCSSDLLAVVTIPSGFSKDASSLAGDAPVQAQLQVQTSTSHGYLVGAVAQALTAHLPAGVSAQLTQQYVGGTLGAFAQLRSGVGQAGDAASEIASATGQAAEGARQLGAATVQLTGGRDRLTPVLRALERKSVAEGKRVPISVDLRGRR